MNKKLIAGCVLAGLLLTGAAFWLRPRGSWMASFGSGAVHSARSDSGLEDFIAGLSNGRRRIQVEQDRPAPPLPAGHEVPRNEQELLEFVAWMRSIGHDELLRLSNAEYDFEDSELVELLKELKGPWVVAALGDLALAEADPLMKAVLVDGLVGTFKYERIDDDQMLPILDSLMSQMSLAAEDPYRVARGIAATACDVCERHDQDYVQLMASHLATSDNGRLLTLGYLLMGHFPDGEQTLKEMLTGHESAEGRMGALEGLRHSRDMVSPTEITALGLSALEAEENARNRLLLYEMMISSGGDDGLLAVEQIARAGKASDLLNTVEMLAMKMDPAQARTLFHDILAQEDLDAEVREATYRALALVEGEEGVNYLLGLAQDPELDGAERLAGLRGLWNRPVDERLAGELQWVFETAEDAELRQEALRMLTYGEGDSDLDLRDIGALDRDPAVRSEAVLLASMQPSEDTRAWLEQRMLEDDSIDVKAAALGALVFHAHYSGEGDSVLGYLDQARRFTGDEETLDMIAEGEKMVKNYDPRGIDLELAKEAEFWTTVAGYTNGPAQRAFSRRGKQLERLVSALRSSAR